MTEATHRLKRSLSLPEVMFYGLGTMIGGGIYALTGKVAGQAGMYAPLSFVLSALLALMTAFSYAELTARYPRNAGEMHYVTAAFGNRSFSILIGWLVVFMATISAAALVTATAGFLRDFIDLPTPLLILSLVALLGFISAWGIKQSVWVVSIITLIEIGGLFLVVSTNLDALALLPQRWNEMVPPTLTDFPLWVGIMSGAFLAFYAFIGFEDMVNITEEVKSAPRIMPIAVMSCILITLVIYLLVITTAVLSVPPSVLAQSNTPLATILSHSDSQVPDSLMGIISILATVNGALVQIVMASRVMYGMANAGKAPSFLREVHASTRTPLKAISGVILLLLIAALTANLEKLAGITSAIILFVFMSINIALFVLKASPQTQDSIITMPRWFSLFAAISCLMMLVFGLTKSLLLS